jgi:tryptophan synthase beta chain
VAANTASSRQEARKSARYTSKNLLQIREGSPARSHKPNTVLAQAYYNNKAEGVKRLATETGAGQWGSALSLACVFFGLECKVFMVRVSYEQKPY